MHIPLFNLIQVESRGYPRIFHFNLILMNRFNSLRVEFLVVLLDFSQGLNLNSTRSELNFLVPIAHNSTQFELNFVGTSRCSLLYYSECGV